ncbi:hypothetical protein P9G84_02880 [Brevibacillus centrosporus]|uniref:hypothetical protein n=1 Tax=Brevibacillus centrosporus TaxID=54910 RepID=UPI000F0A630E|nr:hypothetical protein [Brevibacillus centrosporus]MEC2127939.1 hypothetical protein [Brevibacillus centrosporus]RNB68179.1 hypothetical protein EDM55_17545 [Brevibacillus centrosporus]GED32812.1 hypothetical protein BCE02nite_39530 [Brevibacillus centrosporus]
MKFGKLFLVFAMLLSFASFLPHDSFAATTKYCDDQQNDNDCSAKPEYSSYWTKLGPASNYWRAGYTTGYAMFNSSSNISKSNYAWVFLKMDSPGNYYPAVWLNSSKFVDLVYYEWNGNQTVLDQEYATAGWNYLEDLSSYTNTGTYLSMDRSSYYGGMGADGAQLQKEF